MNLHLYPSPLKNESRIERMTKTLSSASIFDHIVVIGKSKELRTCQLDEHRWFITIRDLGTIECGIASKLWSIISWYLSVLEWARYKHISCVNCHSLSTLPLGVILKYKKRAKLVYEPHELETESLGLPMSLRGVARSCERLCITHADSVITVNTMIREWYQKKYRLPRLLSVYNYPQQEKSVLREKNKLRTELGISADSTIWLYQGLLVKSRGIGVFMNCFKRILGSRGDHHLVIMGYGSLQDKLEQESINFPNIHIRDSVSPSNLLAYTRDADVGLCLIEEDCMSYYMSSPNKLFEYISSGLAVLGSRCPEIRKAITDSRAGWSIHPTEEDIQRVLTLVTKDEIQAKKEAARRYRNNYRWEDQIESIIKEYRFIGFPKEGRGKA